VNPTSKVAFTAKAKSRSHLELTHGEQRVTHVSTQDSGINLIEASATETQLSFLNMKIDCVGAPPPMSEAFFYEQSLIKTSAQQ
jgi:hypothetical protein